MSMRHYDGPPRTFQEVKRLNRVLLDAFYSLGLSRYTAGRMEWAQTQSKMRANRQRVRAMYAVKHYPQWTHPEMMRQLWKRAFGLHRQPVRADARRALPRPVQPLAHGFHRDLRASGRRQAGPVGPVQRAAQGSRVGPRHARHLARCQEEKPASQGRAVGERRPT